MQTTALVDGEASARRSKKTFGPHGCMRTARIARKDVNFEAPFGGLGSFSCKRSFYSRNAYFELQSQWLAKTVEQPARREDIVNLPLFCRLGVFSIERQWRLDRPALEEAVSASEDLAHFRNVLCVLEVSFWSQEKI